MFKHLWVEHSHVCLTQNIFKKKLFIIILEPILTSTLAAGIYSAGCACLRSWRPEWR